MKRIYIILLIIILSIPASSAFFGSDDMSTVVSQITSFWMNVSGQPQLNESVTFIPGQNIALSQDTTNKTITITGAATWTLTSLNSTDIQTETISGYTVDANSTLRAIEFHASPFNYIWYYVYNPINDNIVEILHFSDKIQYKICQWTSGNCVSTQLEINQNGVNINGILTINGKDLEQELVKTSVKSFQADYLNSSNIFSDIIIIPQNINLTNITVVIENSTNTTNKTLNFSLERFTNYPTTKETIFSSSFNQSTNYLNGLQYSFNENDVLLLNYTTYINVSKSSSMFKFKVR